MKTTIKKVNVYTREISIVIPWEDLEAAFEIHIRRFILKIKLPGFRKGKVPRKSLIQKFGPEMEAEIAQNSIEIHYAEALQEHKIIQKISYLIDLKDSDPSFLASSNCDITKSLSDRAKAILASNSKLLD